MMTESVWTNKTGVLLLNLGTPDRLSTSAVRSYLNEFLSDSRVIDLPSAARFLLVKGVILPFRPRKTKAAYQEIWKEEGSPLLLYTKELAEKLQVVLGDAYRVDFAMRYGNPSIENTLKVFEDCDELLVLPLYPQYAASSTASSLAKVYDCLSKPWNVRNITTVRSFYNNPSYIEALTMSIQAQLKDFEWDHILFSYHGIPERHLTKSGCSLIEKPCRENPCPETTSSGESCYRYQCYETTRLVAKRLDIPKTKYSVGFQSRLGRTPWIKPYTDEMLSELHQSGVRSLAVACPSFVVDCLETIEEIGMRLKEDWSEYPETRFRRIECLNTDQHWVERLSQLVTDRL